MPDYALEDSVAEYLLQLTPEDRELAFRRVHGRIDVETPIEELDPPPPISTLREFLAEELFVPAFLVSAGQVARGEITATVARAGKGKTTIAMNRLIRWSAGLPLFDALPECQAPVNGDPLRVLFIANEGNAAFLQDKLGDLLEAHLPDDDHRELARDNLLIWGDGAYSGLKLDRDECLEDIDRACDLHRPDILLMEPFRGLWSGEENSATEMENVLDRLAERAKRHGFGVVLTHHERKGGAGEDGEWMSASRGSVVLEDKAAVMENLRRIKDGQLNELSWSKSRYAPEHGPVRMEFDKDTWRYLLVPEDDIMGGVLNAIADGDWYTAEEVAETTEETVTAARKRLTELVEAKRVKRDKKASDDRGHKRLCYRLLSDEIEDTGKGLSVA